MTAFDLLTIGHSNIAAERFTAMLHAAGVEAVADVRSIPVSRFCAWFSAKNLAPLLAGANIDYQFYGDELGGRPRGRSIAMASPITRPWGHGRASRLASIGCTRRLGRTPCV